MTTLRIALVAVLLVFAAACSTGSDSPAATSTPTAARTPSPTSTGAPPVTPTTTPTSEPTGTPVPPTATIDTRRPEPTGLPIGGKTLLGAVVGEVGSRSIDWSAGAILQTYAREVQPSDDPVAANAMGWNCRTHVEYEGAPAVDWYVPIGTPIATTMDGQATLYVISLPNAFDYYGVSREPYIGEPDRDRAPLSPFPGPGGGKGVFIEVVNSGFATEYGHLDLAATLSVVPAIAYVDGYSASFDYETPFGAMRAFNDATAVASWPVRAGDVIGYSGDAGYSEAPHLHYTVRRTGGPLLCPTTEPGFEDGGWLFR